MSLLTSLLAPGNATYIPADGDAMFLHPSAFPSTSGPATSNIGEVVRAITFNPTDNAWIGTTVELPDWWATFDVDLYWANAAAGTGDVRWRLDRREVAEGGSLTAAFTTGTNNYLTAGAQDVLTIDTIESGLTVTPSRLIGAKLWRIGGGAEDTLANNALFLGLMFRRAS